MFDKSVYPARRRAPWERKRPKLTHYERMLYNSIISISWQNVWYYRDRMNVPRGPCQLPVLRQVGRRRFFLFALSSVLELTLSPLSRSLYVFLCVCVFAVSGLDERSCG